MNHLAVEIRNTRAWLHMPASDEFDMMSADSQRTWLARFTYLKHELQRDPRRVKAMQSHALADAFLIDLVDAIALLAWLDS